MIRLAILGIHHETNTFSSILADREAYESGGIRRGEAITAHYEGSGSTYGGYLSRIEGDEDVELVPLMDSMVNPKGALTSEIYQSMAAEMLEMLEKQGPFNGVLLGIHGAGVAEGEPSLDADIAERVRAVVGPDAAIGAVLDMHANVDARLVTATDVLAAYQTNPHVDPAARARFVKAEVLRIIRGAARPAQVVVQIPMIVNITAQDTSTSPMREILEFAGEVAREHSALDVSVVEGFPYADVEHMGMSVIALHPDPASATTIARTIADRIWSLRESLQGNSVSVDEAIAAINAHTDSAPLLVLDVGDNIGGGGPGDSTVLLAAALAGGVSGLVCTIWDPLSIDTLASTSLGEQVSVVVGGKSREQEGTPVELVATLEGRHSGLFEASEIAHGGFRYFDGGDMVALRTDTGNVIVLTEKPVQTVTPAQLEAVGLSPRSFRAIVGKGVNAPRAGYSSVCGDILVVDTPGVTRASVTAFSYENRRTPLYPFELGCEFDSAEA